MITVCGQVLLLPWTSTTVQVTALVPTGKLAGALLVRLATAQLSEVTGAPRTTPLTLHRPGPALVVTPAGQVIVGNWLATTVPVCVQVALWPWMSVTVQSTLVVPTLNTLGASLITVATLQLSA